MSEKLTPWFPMRVEPTRHGVYQTCAAFEDAPRDYYSLFDGKWRGDWYTPERAYDNRSFHSGSAASHWRGLTSDPKATK